MSDCGAELQLFGIFDPPFEVIAMHGNPVIVQGDGMLRSIVGADAALVAFPLEELAGDAMAADGAAFVPNPCLVGRIEDRVEFFEHGAFPLPLC